MRFPFVFLTAALAVISAAQAPTAAGSPKNLAFSTNLKSVAVFRDGFGYYVREGKVKLENGWATTNLMPNAVRGTVWFYSPESTDRIDQVLISKDNRVAFASTGEIKAKLGDKIGLNLNVETITAQHFEGELSKVLDDMLLLKVGDAYNAVPYSQVKAINLVGYPVRIKVDCKDPNKVATIGMAYLQDGIKWDPSYILDVHGKTAELNLRASMQNPAEKLDGTDVYFVVGAPFVSNRGIQDLLGMPAMAAGSPAPAEKAADKPSRTSPSFPDVPEPVASAALSRDEAGELYYYRKPGLTLGVSDIAMVSIVDASIPVSPSFEWDANGEEVSYLLDLQNKTGHPLTTGPVFVLDNGKAIGQETIKYTPAGGVAQVKLSRGIGIKVDKSESEGKRGAPIQIGKVDYIPVTLRGTLTITNFRTEPAAMKVTRTVRGKVDSQSDDGRVKQTQILNGEPNPVNDLEWKVNIPAGATKTITYSFQTYMSAERAGSPPVPSGSGD